MNYSLSFFGRASPPQDFWNDITAERAEAAANRARISGCKPHYDSNELCGVATAWVGPSVGEVISNLRRAEGRGR